MGLIADFYSKLAPGVYHNQSGCSLVGNIAPADQVPGTGGYTLCPQCSDLAKQA
jgi:hypothetical protein